MSDGSSTAEEYRPLQQPCPRPVNLRTSCGLAAMAIDMIGDAVSVSQGTPLCETFLPISPAVFDVPGSGRTTGRTTRIRCMSKLGQPAGRQVGCDPSALQRAGNSALTLGSVPWHQALTRAAAQTRCSMMYRLLP